MADESKKLPENVPGRYYVDDTCISCGACWLEAPENFMSHEVQAYSFVFKQPVNAEEEDQCRSAKEICPVEAIGVTQEKIQSASE